MVQHEVDRCQMDGNFWSDLRSGRTIFQDRVDRRSTVKKVEMRSSALMHFPSLPILRGAPGSVGFSLFWGSPFLGLVHEGSCQGLLLRIDRSFEFEIGLRFLEFCLYVIIFFTRMIVAVNIDGSFSFTFRSYTVRLEH